jgi:hypothetical protein
LADIDIQALDRSINVLAKLDITQTANRITTPTEVTYFSAYMHLSHIANCPKRNAPWKAGDDIYRKDELGAPGQIYGHSGQIHFEICCDEANLRQFVPRAPAWADPLAPTAPTADGRTDSVFGSMYVYFLPRMIFE